MQLNAGGGKEGKMRKQERAESAEDGEKDEEESETGEEDPLRWSERGIPDFFETTDAHKGRHKRSPESDVSLSATAPGKLPSLDGFIGSLDPGTGKLPLGAVVRASSTMARISTKGVLIDGKLACLNKQLRCCESRLCVYRATPVHGQANGLRGKKVDTVCLCKRCSKIGGVVMCKQCYGDKKKHLSALQFATSSQKDGKRRARISTKGHLIDGKLAHLHKQRRCCESRLCASRTTPVHGRTDGLRGEKVDTACLCKPCSEIGGVVMCKQCYGDEKKRLSALQFAASSQKDGKRRARISTEGILIDGKLAHLNKQRLYCESRLCASRTTPVHGRTDGLRGKKVDTACLCKPCSEIGGVVMCKQCYGDKKKHLSALQFAASSQKYGKGRDRTQLKFRSW